MPVASRFLPLLPIAMALALSGCVSNIWSTATDENLLGGDGRTIVVGEHDRYRLVFTCLEHTAGAALFTAEPFSEEDAANRDARTAQISLLADGNMVQAGPARMASADGTLAAGTEAGRDSLQRLGAAKRKITATLSVAGKVRHSADFPARGAAGALDAFAAKCGALANGGSAG